MKKNKTVFVTSQVLLLLFVSAALYNFSGCSNSVTNTGTLPVRKNQSRTEQEFSRYTDLKAEAGAVIAVDLEGLNSPSAMIGDTGPIGEDIIPYNYIETAEHRFAIDDSSAVRIKLVSDATGLPVVELNPGGSVYVTIPEGNYKLHVIALYEYSVDMPASTIFIQANTETAYMGSGGVIYSTPDVDRFIRQRGCSKCDMSGADFSGMSLEGIRCSEAKFNSAKFVGTKIRSTLMHTCTFDSTNFSGMLTNPEGGGFNFFRCTIKNANLTGLNCYNIEFKETTFDNCNFSGSRLVRPNWVNCTISNSNMQRFEVAANILDGIDFIGVNGKHMYFNINEVKNSTFKNSNFDSCQVYGSFCTSTSDLNSTFWHFIGSASCFPPHIVGY